MKILILQHLDVETPGSFLDFFKADGASWDTVRLDHGEHIPDLAPYDMMAVMGGPQDVWEEDIHPWLVAEKQAIKTFVTRMKRPYLGFCLGHQLLAEAIGGSVGKASRGEIGVFDVVKTEAGHADPLLKGISDPLEALQWHGAEVQSLPSDAVVLASSPACKVQAFRYGPHAYGLQFHVEATQSTVDDWSAVPAYAKGLEAALGADGARQVYEDVEARLPAFRRDASAIWRNFKLVMANSASASAI